ncbi:hypothetical protein A0J61_07799 [Choanephora cucurbitarum]|uniref:Uncharacterized protein n=1 Tax=Choanephora cucurbitarum TaxID=101091 RepID=A0A1C7N535_9FUNG|nr:hypothetical protein A0J61_07799 [Choanephora cucurbitarum]
MSKSQYQKEKEYMTKQNLFLMLSDDFREDVYNRQGQPSADLQIRESANSIMHENSFEKLAFHALYNVYEAKHSGFFLDEFGSYCEC